MNVDNVVTFILVLLTIAGLVYAAKKKADYLTKDIDTLTAMEDMCNIAEDHKISYMLDGEDVEQGMILKGQLDKVRQFIEEKRR